MSLTRRGLLGLAVCTPVLPVVACAPDPAITGGPSAPFSPTPTAPVQSPAAAQAAAWTSAQAAVLELLGKQGKAWEVPAGTLAWVAGATECAQAHLDRLLSADPFTGEAERVFPAPQPTSPPAADLQAALAALDAGAAEGVDLFASLAAAAETQPDRLLYVSLAISAQGFVSRAVPPARTDAAPIRFADSTPDASLGVVLTHVWALIQGLELAAGRLASGAARDKVVARMPVARQLRDRLRDAVTGDVPGQAAYYEMPGPMGTDAEVTSAMAILEGNLLGAFARLVSSWSDTATWWPDMLGQVTQTTGWGGALPFWPGWSAAA